MTMPRGLADPALPLGGLEPKAHIYIYIYMYLYVYKVFPMGLFLLGLGRV